MVAAVQRIWELGDSTYMCCQDLDERDEGLRTGDNPPLAYVGSAFVENHRGFAWLKMPLEDALSMRNVLRETPFRERITKRWEPASLAHERLVDRQQGRKVIGCSRGSHPLPEETDYGTD